MIRTLAPESGGVGEPLVNVGIFLVFSPVVSGEEGIFPVSTS